MNGTMPIEDDNNRIYPGCKFTRGQMLEIFNQIQNKEDWKAPIRCWVNRDQIELVKESIMFFTGTETEIASESYGKHLIHSIGYRAGPCGDN